jgi:DNA-binding IclR family transcriptional regulator
MAAETLVRSLSKGLDVLRLVGNSDRGLRLGEIAEALAQKVPATHYMVRTLLARGFLEKRSGNLLHIGPALLEIAGRQQNTSLAAAAEKELLRLHETLPAGAVIFGVATRQEMRQIYRISHERPHVLQRLSGDLLHPYASAAGLVGLAFASDAVRMMMEERHPFAEYGAHLWKARARLEEFLAGVRRDHVAICPFDAELFFRASVPVFDGSRRLAAVVGASIPSVNVPGQRERNRVVRELKESASNLVGEGQGGH